MNKRNRLWYMAASMMILLLAAGNFTGCEPEDWIGNVDCNECFGYQPDSAKLIVYLTINPENVSVPLTFYRGDYGGEVDWQDTATREEFYLDAKIGSTYTVRAEYRSGANTILAFDSDKMTLEDRGSSCGDPCYIVKGGIYEIKLLE